MCVDNFFREHYLTYEMFLELKNQYRFWSQSINTKVYIYDMVTSNIYVLKGNFKNLYEAKDREEFIAVLNKISLDDIKLTYTSVDKILRSSVSPLKTKKVVNTMHLDLNNQCNLACKYCFKDKKRFELKDWSIVTKALEYLVYDCGKDAPEYKIGYCYTSEPLLHFHSFKKLLVEITHLSKKINKEIAVFFTTNGTILTEDILRYFNRISRSFNISIDGNQNVHDEMRLFKNGGGTFSVIESNIQKLRQNNYTLLASSVLTSQYPYPARILSFLLEIGFDDILIKPARLGNELSFNLSNISELKNGYKEYFDMLYQDITMGRFERINKYKGDFLFRFFKRPLLKQKTTKRCYWMENKISLNHLGEFFPCDSALNINDLKIGDVYSGIDWQKFDQFLDVDMRSNCNHCWAKYICGGTCYLQSWINKKDITMIDPTECELNKFFAEKSIGLLFRLIDENINISELRHFFARPSIR